MSNDQRDGKITNLDCNSDYDVDGGEPPSPMIRDIHALTSQRTAASSSVVDGGENFTTISREFNALVLAGSRIRTEDETNLTRIGEESANSIEETNPLAIVLQDTNPPPQSPRNGGGGDRLALGAVNNGGGGGMATMQQQVKKEEAESKISAWQNAKVAKINNRYKREDAVINGWEGQQVQEATSRMKKVERKLEEKRGKGMERMQNDIVKAHRKAEERKASAEAKRGIKGAKIMDIAYLMRAVGRAPAKRSFF